MTTTRLLAGGNNNNNNQIVHGVRGCTVPNNKNGLNTTAKTLTKNSPTTRIQRPCMINKPISLWMMPQNSIDTNIKRSNNIRPTPSTPNNTPYASKNLGHGNYINEKSKNYMCIVNEPFQQQLIEENTTTWNEMLSINSSKSESMSTAHESHKNKHHHYLPHKSHSHRHSKKNEIIGYSGQKPSTDRKVNLLIFNPHRTLQFLVSELKSHLRSPKSDDKNVHKILSEIQQTIKRLESSNSQISDTVSNTNSTEENQGNQENQENRVNKTNNSSCQTDNNNLSICEIVSSIQQTDNNIDNNNINNNPDNKDNENKQNEFQYSEYKTKMETMENEIKKNYEKLTDNYKILERTCKSLNDEKIKISSELCKSQTEILKLKNQVSMLQGALKDTANQEKSATQNFKEQYKSLQDQLKTLQESMTKNEADESLKAESFNTKLQESSARIYALEKSGFDSKKMFVLTKLENEKLAIMEKYRTHQITSMQNNINDIHKYIRRELKGLQECLCNGNGKDITKAISQITSHKMAKFFQDTIKIQNLKNKFPLKKLNTTLKTNSKSYPSMNSNLKSSSKSIKHSTKIDNIITNSVHSSSARNCDILICNETLKLPLPQLPSLSEKSIMGTRIIDVKIKNQPSETSETLSFIDELKENYNKVDVKNQENEFISIDDDDDDNGNVIGVGKNIKNAKIHKNQQYSKEKNIKHYQTKSVSISSTGKNSSSNIKKIHLTNKNEGIKFSTDAYNLFDKESNLNLNTKNVTTLSSYNTCSPIPENDGSMRSPSKTSAPPPTRFISESQKSLKKTQPTTNIEIPLPNLNIPESNRQHFHSDDDEHNNHHHSHRQIDSNEYNKKNPQYQNQYRKSNGNYIVGDGEGYPNDQNHSTTLDPYHGCGNNYNSTYREKTMTNDDNNNNHRHHHHYKNTNINGHLSRTRNKDKISSRHKDRKMSPSNRHKRPQLVQWKKYYWSKVDGNNNHQQLKQKSNEIGGCGDFFTPIIKKETERPILQYTSNFDEFKNMLDDVITSSERDGCDGGGGCGNNRNKNNNKIDISSDLNNSTSFDLSQTEYTDV